jgi:hypothetical protein
MHKVLSEYRTVGEYFTFPYEFAVSILKSMVNCNFVNEVKKNKQLFLPLFIEKPLLIQADIKGMNGLNVNELTVRDMAESLEIPMDTVKSRLRALKIAPVRYVGQAAIYDPGAIDQIREPKPRGRPKKDKK